MQKDSSLKQKFVPAKVGTRVKRLKTLLTPRQIKKLPNLYDRENDDPDQVEIPVKFFDPNSNWTWYLIEVNEDGTCFGLVDGIERELGYWQMSELERIQGKWGVGIERDSHWNPKTTLAQVMAGEKS